MEKMKRYLKTMPVLLVAFMLLAVTGYAAILTHYGQITGTVEVSQSVTVDGLDIGTGSLDITDNGGVHSLKNNANVDVVVELVTECTDNCGDEIVTEYHGILELTKKNMTTWEPTGEPITITYKLVGETFEYSGVPDGYVLIYYKDAVISLGERLENPQPAIIVTEGIGSIPHENDANLDALAGYCGTPDYYVHCTGAKLWAVPISDLLEGGALVTDLNWANMTDYYYETDLMAYSANTVGEITLPAHGGGVDFIIETTVAPNTMPGTYNITTSVNPAL